ncbi:HU family DNA-binding protein [uncultured Bacteroides sp.]|uniref:HU family DNA-binding protein n=1 Tax=uncultured Bacteroides sp. TaxID=162156 RepID=UPI002AAAB66B|nr:HU family DNA-binding protein [uncultured Bacteroides sp.]
MPLFYKPRQSSLKTKDGLKKWHPILVKVGSAVNNQKIADLIAEKASLTPGDVHNVIRNLMTVMREQLLNSRTVKLDGLGSFTVKAFTCGKGVETAKEVSPSQIVRLRVLFTPEYTLAAGTGGATRALFSGVQYERWGEKKKSEEDSSEPGKDNKPGSDDEDPNA